MKLNKEMFKSKTFVYPLVLILVLILTFLMVLVYLHYTFGYMKIYNPVYTADYKEDLNVEKIAEVLEEHNISTYNITDYGLFIRLNGIYGNHTLYDSDVVVVENTIFISLNETSYPRCTYDEALSREKYVKPTVDFMKEIIYEAIGQYPVKEKLSVPD